mmetsp:Transcript_44396/g.71114  ORF Transcript_44396/g.71114 Transcript_44396/m.71114 type:complete len:892 (+) Transcript_44396:4398-7073(+)|eukprot:CAMPEP_0203746140 /NCGR_PEP_ID=MMETSP0098-20131031/1670_1 /ASSEMBLY_ACC=CAM_ASM_000208 /TAXON_ID=96639 /ORGANISM=" , Strain NY0313808BC1" /LENGTH=891 /DNA_ID=CAMNT_0050634125 /DNA_START=4369 /DNA_END=7044 /DNA_ORIENTATION=-
MDNQGIFRKDYKVPPFWAKHVDLTFEFGDPDTLVRSKVVYERNRVEEDLVLNGATKAANMRLQMVKLNGNTLAQDLFKVDDFELAIPAKLLEHSNIVEIEVLISPGVNTTLEGLYKTGEILCTQCEAEGFRNMTYFIDRPDNLSIYTTKIIADKSRYPTLLGNGNKVDSGELTNGRHFVTWQDPWPKPSYLFAVVGGDFDSLTDSFVTRSGRTVKLGVYVEKGEGGKAEWAMGSLKRSFKWDEDRFDREYDLDTFNVVAVSDFNGGAMENKGLNIFDSSCVLVSNETATDAEFLNVESTIGHEYFHNWSGNRVTCKDWFQLTLKEGLTVYRDQLFTKDLHSAVCKRIQDVEIVRGEQFMEDASPMAHPIRPESYIAMDNFYSTTVYEKGAEVVGMINTIVGEAGFKKGLNLYFERHDGCAVACEDFVSAMADANPSSDLEQFMNTWYFQAGTPHVDIRASYDQTTRTYTLRTKQTCSPTPGQPVKKPFDIPFKMGLLGSVSQKPLPLKLKGMCGSTDDTTILLRIREAEQEFVFTDIGEKPVPSFLRDFSAPITVSCCDLTRSDLAFLASHDSNEYCRYEAVQELAKQIFVESAQNSGALDHEDVPLLVNCLKKTLHDTSLDKGVVAKCLYLPHYEKVAQFMDKVNPEEICRSGKSLKEKVVSTLYPFLLEVYKNTENSLPDETHGQAVARRALKNASLGLLTKVPEEENLKHACEIAHSQYQSAQNMTDRMGALHAVNNVDCEQRTEMLRDFRVKYEGDKLVLQKWMCLQAASSLCSLETLVAIENDSTVFDITNPNCCESLFEVYGSNFAIFNKSSGKGYEYLADKVIKLDKINPQVAAGVARKFLEWHKFELPWSSLAHAQLERIAREDLCPDVFEVVKLSLGSQSTP